MSSADSSQTQVRETAAAEAADGVGPGDGASGGAVPGAGERGRWTAWARAAILAGIAVFAHRALIWPEPSASPELPLSAEVEAFFFEPSETSPALVLLFVGWLLFRRGRRLARSLGQPGAPALTLALLAAGIGSFYWAQRTGVASLQAVALFFEGLGVVHAFGGLPALRVAIVPAAFLVFALPLPAPLLNAVIWRLQLWTAEYAGLLMYLLGMPALVAGDQILQSDKVFQIIESCSGLRTAETLTMLAVLMVDLFRRRGVHALVLILAALPVSFLVNGFRALTLILNPHSDIAAVHNLQGIVMLLAGVLLLYGLDGLLERFVSQRPATLPKRAVEAEGGSRLRGAWLQTGALVLTLAALSVALKPWTLDSPERQPVALAIGEQVDGWRGEDVETDRMFLGRANFAQILDREYRKRRRQINVFVGVAGLSLQSYSFHTPKTAIPATGWIVEEQSREQRGERQIDVLKVRRGTQRLLIHHWRQGSGGLLYETLRSALALDRSPFRRRWLPVVVRLSTPVSGSAAGREAGEQRLEAFSASLYPLLKQWDTPGDPMARKGNAFLNYVSRGNRFPHPPSPSHDKRF